VRRDHHQALDVQIAVGPGLVSQLLNANDRGHWATKEARRRYWLDTTIYRLRGHPRSSTSTSTSPSRSPGPTAAAATSGTTPNTRKVIVDASSGRAILTDDSDRYVTGPDMRRAYGPHEIRLTITPGDRP
jgi:hypothetical protein